MLTRSQRCPSLEKGVPPAECPPHPEAGPRAGQQAAEKAGVTIERIVADDVGRTGLRSDYERRGRSEDNERIKSL